MWDAHESEEGWKEFLHDCDYLSSIKYRPVGGKVEDKSQYTYSSVNV
jgi:hypothetical protein